MSIGTMLSAQTPRPRFEVASIKKLDQPASGLPGSPVEGDTLRIVSSTVASRNAGMPVFDRTGLTGRWHATIYYAPDPNLGTSRLAVAPDPNLASFAVALQEQLGLKLEPTRGPVDVLVIDSVRQPTED